MSAAQQVQRTAWIAETLPPTTREAAAWIEREFAIVYESRLGLVALLHRLRMEHRKPKAVSGKLDEDRQKAFMEALLTALTGDEAVMFADAGRPLQLR